nr:hypothetical protein [uncultured Mediterranean phage uvMED]
MNSEQPSKQRRVRKTIMFTPEVIERLEREIMLRYPYPEKRTTFSKLVCEICANNYEIL